MKVQLTLGQPALNGYMCLDPLTSPNQTDKIQCDPTNVDPIVDHNEASELLVLDVIDYVPLFLREKVLTHWMSKVAHNGILILSATDMSELSRLIYNGQFSDAVSTNHALFGSGQNLWTIKKSFIPCQNTMGTIVSTGQFNIEHVKYEGFKYYITARRK